MYFNMVRKLQFHLFLLLLAFTIQLATANKDHHEATSVASESEIPNNALVKEQSKDDEFYLRSNLEKYPGLVGDESFESSVSGGEGRVGYRRAVNENTVDDVNPSQLGHRELLDLGLGVCNSLCRAYSLFCWCSTDVGDRRDLLEGGLRGRTGEGETSK